MRELLEERSFAELSVSAISERAGIARSGFYFYFDSKYEVLALILDEATHELEELTHDFAPRDADETPAAFAKRMVGSAAAVYAAQRPDHDGVQHRAEHRRRDPGDPGPPDRDASSTRS